jgi:hypothetical protein
MITSVRRAVRFTTQSASRQANPRRHHNCHRCKPSNSNVEFVAGGRIEHINRFRVSGITSGLGEDEILGTMRTFGHDPTSVLPTTADSNGDSHSSGQQQASAIGSSPEHS